MPDPNKSLLERLADFLTPQPTSPAERRQELIDTLREAQTEGLIDADALSMIEGVLRWGSYAPAIFWCRERRSTGSTLICLYQKLLKA